MAYKYQDKIDAIEAQNGSSCTQNFTEKTIPAYRWTFESIDDEKNFEPMGSKHPGLRNKCGGWALSFHETEEKSISAWEFLTCDKPKKIKKLGTHIALGTIEETHGVCSDTDSYGHFECHEYVDTDFSNNFTVVKKLVKDES